MSASAPLSVKTVSLIIVIGIIAAGLGFWVSMQANKAAPELSAFVYPISQDIADFTLTDHTGSAFTPSHFFNKWTMVFFGYTNCPDICPNTLMLLNQFEKALSKQGDLGNTQILFVSVDPERDSPEQLASYIAYYNNQFIGATGSIEELGKLTKSLGGVSYIGDKDSEGRYDVDHSSAIVLIDPAGQLRARFSAPQRLNTLLSDFRYIRSEYND